MSDLNQRMRFTGERFVPEESGNIVIEHLHRYLSAATLVDSKVVLDIASGEGYGSDLLARHAEQVYGVDVAADAVEHASARYRRDNLEFRVGDCSNIPLPDHSVDIIVSFETLEHYDQHEESFIEFKRVLRPGGKLLISSPDKKYYSDARNYHNEFHVKELYEEEFRELVGRHFKNTVFYTQRIAFGSVLLPVSEQTATRSYRYTQNEITSSTGVVEPLYLMALASDGEPGALEAGIFEQPINETEIIQSWERVMAERDAEVDQLRRENDNLAKTQHALDTECRRANDNLANTQHALDTERRRANELAALNETMVNSKSWMLTAPLRSGRRRLGKLLSLSSFALIGEGGNFNIRLKNALGYLRRGDLQGLISRSRHYRRQAHMVKIQQMLGRPTENTWGIMTTPHTIFLAQCIAERLSLHGIKSVLLTQPPVAFDHDFYIVLCPQMFDRLPPGEKRVAFQLEQSVSTRWFTDAYFSTLENSVAMLDYSLTNIEFLANKGLAYPHVFYLPIGTSLERPPVTPPSEKEYDFLFYGDYYSSPRRAKMLDVLKDRFNVKLCNNAFGEEMHDLIRKARVVVNIHFYENALLEMPRIQECLSQGVPVLSESAQDQDDYPELSGAVHFFDQGSTEDMLRVAEAMLQASGSFDEAVARSVDASARRFNFMFDRFLTAIGVLPAQAILEQPIYLPEDKPQIALSLPETIGRRRTFMEEKPGNCSVFDGIRNAKGWIGCGCSYSALARHALANGRNELVIFEDDALFRDDHDVRLATVRDYLDRTQRWDVFSGVIASVHESARVLNVEEVNGMTFVKLNRMTSTVFNIYNRRAIELLAGWDPTNQDVDANTIDRYLENQDDLHVVVTLPFLVGHREDVTSTIWGFENDRYAKMIVEAENRIRLLADGWKSSKVDQMVV